jgi:hypothetical protein
VTAPTRPGPPPATASATPAPVRVRKPKSGPSKAQLAERDRFAQLTATSLESVRVTAQTWRNGLAGFITLVTTGVIIKGRDTTSNLTTGGRVTVTVLVGAGLALAVAGLWLALTAEAGLDTRTRDLHGIRQEHLTLRNYEVAVAERRARMLGIGRWVVAGALACLLGGVAAAWWAPAEATSPPAYVRVSVGSTVSCGELTSADGGNLVIKVAGRREPAVIPVGQVTNLTVTASCS